MTDPRGALRFWKMTGAGNDFVVLPLSPDALPDGPEPFVRSVCRRGLSVGADGVLFVIPSGVGAVRKALPPVDDGLPRRALVVHYNADGGRSAFCGNGTRCAARFAILRGFARSPMILETDVGALRADVSGESVRIEAPPPSVPQAVVLDAAGRSWTGWSVGAGVPHLVIPVGDPDEVDVERVGAALRAHPSLGSEGANVDFLGPEEGGEHRLRTFERGVEGETLSCGSGALAAAACSAHRGEPPPMVLRTRSGSALIVTWSIAPGGPADFLLEGEARVVFVGRLAEALPEAAGP